jgi:hypothetical protein
MPSEVDEIVAIAIERMNLAIAPSLQYNRTLSTLIDATARLRRTVILDREAISGFALLLMGSLALIVPLFFSSQISASASTVVVATAGLLLSGGFMLLGAVSFATQKAAQAFLESTDWLESNFLPQSLSQNLVVILGRDLALLQSICLSLTGGAILLLTISVCLSMLMAPGNQITNSKQTSLQFPPGMALRRSQLPYPDY